MTRDEFVEKWMAACVYVPKTLAFADIMNSMLDHDAEQRQVIEQQAQQIAWLQERDEVAKWYETLVTRAKIGTKQTPSLKSYIEQLEEQIATLREALEALLTENEDYIRINNLSAMGNVNLVNARKALKEHP